MALSDLNVFAIIVAALVNNILGFIYYHPKVFGSAWMKLSGIRMEDAKSPGMAYAFTAIGALISAVALAVVIDAFGRYHWIDGLGVGALVAVGFLVPVLGMDAVFNQKKIQLYFLNTAYYVIAFMAMGAILGAWN